jgi:hypothetical protein
MTFITAPALAAHNADGGALAIARSGLSGGGQSG